MVCRALAKESGANMLQIQASTIRSKWHSEDEKLIHATFTLARRLGPCVVFIDEIEALFGKRSESHSLHRATLTEFLQEMDGLKTAAENRANKIVIVGATNRPQDLDDAVLRRLPRRVLVDLPDTAERAKIIKHYLTGEKIDDTVDIPALAERTPHYSGSDLKHLVFSAALSAFKDSVPDLWSAHTQKKNVVGDDAGKKLPQRVIGSHHFDKALLEVVASASAHLESIAELRNWGGSSGV